ncbi:MAG: endonuclease V [Acidimicrobiia bacterium]
MTQRWPLDAAALATLQDEIATAAAAHAPVALDAWPLLGGCFIAFARGEAGPGHPGDRAWAAAVTWRPAGGVRDEGAALRGVRHDRGPRVARDLEGQVVVADEVPAAYRAGFLAMREGAILERAVSALATPPVVLLVDATGRDHPRRAGLAVHLGWALDVPTVGVTHRTLHADGPEPAGERGATAPISLDGEVVGNRVVTRTGARAVVAHAGWRTTPAQAAEVVLLASTPASRTPVPLGEARRAAREARSIAEGSW